MTPAEAGIMVGSIFKTDPNDITARGRVVYIGRWRQGGAVQNPTVWAMPAPIMRGDAPASRLKRLNAYRAYVLESPELVERLKRGELLGRWLACNCYAEPTGPEPPDVPYCHGDILRELQAQLYEVKANSLHLTDGEIRGAIVAALRAKGYAPDPSSLRVYGYGVELRAELSEFQGHIDMKENPNDEPV
jgi:hypothetical protein